MKPGGGLRLGVEMISAGSGFHPGAGGMISYYDGLLGALCARPDVASIVVFVAPENGALAVPDDPKIELVRCGGLPRTRAGRVAYEQLVLGLLARRRRVDVLLCTTNIMPLLRRAPTVVVLQSIQYFMWPGQASPLRRAYLHFFTPRSLRRADVVIAVTETERRDALSLFEIDPDRIVSVHHGVSNWTKAALEHVEPPVPHRLASGDPYVLVVSRLYDFKNHRRLIEAFARLAMDPAFTHHLLIAGGDADVTRADLRAHAAEHGVADRVHLLGSVPQDEIPGLFAGADAIAYVSLYETFGHPVLEAFAFGRPLLTSATSATAEVAGGAARLVDPESVSSIAAGLHDVLNDGELRGRLAVAGPARVAAFTWERCAEGTLAAVLRAQHRRAAEPGHSVPTPLVEARPTHLKRRGARVMSTQVDNHRDIVGRALLGAARSVVRKPEELRYHVVRDLWSVTKRFASSSVRNVEVRELPCLQDAVIEGYIDDPNRAVLAALCRSVGARTFFEIGTNRGRTAWTVARNNPEIQVYTLDLPSPDAAVALDLNDADRNLMGDGWASGEAFADTEEARRITPLYGDSATFDFSPYEGRMDVVFIDGAHSYSYVRSDTEAALGMVAPGGTIAWDDYPAIPGVYRCLNELEDDQVHPLIHVYGTRLVISTPHDLLRDLGAGGYAVAEVA